MQNPFERHGIDHLSPSSINLFIEQPSFWAAKYLLKFEDSGPAMWRGTAVEAGLDEFLFNKSRDTECRDGCLRRALDRFDLEGCGLCDDRTLKERDRVPAMLAAAMRAAEGFDPPTLRQNRVEIWLDDIDVPVWGNTDYEWETWGLELKTVSRMPSEITARHARQVSIYTMARDKPFKVLYVTEAKDALRELSREDIALNMKRVQWYAHNIRRVLSVSADSAEVAALYPPDLDSFYWKGEEARKFAAERWNL